MPYTVPMTDAQGAYPNYKFIKPLTPSEQKAAFHVQDEAGKDLCFKIIAPNYSLDRLEREIEALQSINHPNVVSLVEYTYSSRQGGTNKHFIIEEYIEGSDLAKYVQPGNIWTLEIAAPFFAMLCDGLYAMHNKQIVHRDLKPTNIRVRPDGSPVIIDFGLARHLSLPDITRTVDGTGVGTPAYFSPEQFNGRKADIDARTDLFAIGIILYQVLVGQHPFLHASMTIADLNHQVCNSKECLNNPTFLALPKNWQLLITRLLEKERAKRPQNAEIVAVLLRKFAAGGVA
ncbi:MAG: serine/threonine protein kinase [Pedobacter sp.]|nr:MAG: serine/threonine protein kinase [Pedobacter sp.]